MVLIAGSTYGPDEMCLEVLRHILVLPITHFGSYYAHVAFVMDTQKVHNKTQKCAL
jgi:hypothetical protein